MSELVSSIRWGFLFLFLDINLGRFDILPNFVGYFFWLETFREYREKAPELYRLCTFCKIMGIVELVNWLLKPEFLLVSLLTMLLNLYLYYTILTWAADYAQSRGYEEAAALERLRNMLVIFQVAVFALLSFLGNGSIVLLLILVIAQAGSFLTLCALVSQEREREEREKEEQKQEEQEREDGSILTIATKIEEEKEKRKRESEI